MKKRDKEVLYELKKKNPTAAVWWSIFIIGAGQFYNEEYGKGIAMLLGSFALWFFMMGWVFWFISPIDAYHSAKRKNEILKAELEV